MKWWKVSLKRVKSELDYRYGYKTKEQPKTVMFEYINTCYNTIKLHSSLDCKTPKEIELEFMNIKNAV